MKKTLPTLLLITLFFTTNAFAFDKKGEYITGGGVGSISCSMYISLLNRAELSGGLGSIAGINIINAYMNYTLGFQTGYNPSHLGKKDVFEKFGTPPTNKILPLVGEWCEKNLDKNFGNGLVAVVTRVNESDEDYWVSKGDKIAQFVLHQNHNVVTELFDEKTITERGGKGFGSSGK